MSLLDKTFTATLQTSGAKGAWTYVVMPSNMVVVRLLERIQR